MGGEPAKPTAPLSEERVTSLDRSGGPLPSVREDLPTENAPSPCYTGTIPCEGGTCALSHRF